MEGVGRVEIRLLGRFAVLRDGAEIPSAAFEGRKVRTLVKVLASRQGRFVSNDALADALWPGRPPVDPAANLQVLVNRARRALGDPGLIVTGQRGYTLAASPACDVDAERFVAAVSDRAQSWAGLRATLSRWQGDPLPEETYDDWAADYRARLLRTHQHALETAANLALDAGDLDAAVELASSAVEAEPLREVAVLLLVRALAAAGDGGAALTAYDDFRRALADELGVDPSPEAVALYEGLLRRLPARDESSQRRRGSGVGELAFVGREQELELMRSALAAGRRGAVVTISGASGSGKSRLLDRAARGVPMVRARAFPAERSEPWTLLRTLLREALAQDIGYVGRLPPPMDAALAWLLPELGSSGGIAPDPESRRILVQEAALRLLGAAGTLIAVDDLQWCDPTSLGVLEAVIRRAEIGGTVLAFRPEEVTDREDLADFLARSDVMLRVDLGGLPEESLHELVADTGIVEAIGRHTDRTPMAVTEILRALAAEGLVVPTPGGPLQASASEATARAVALAREGQRTAIAARVGAQSGPDRKVLAMLALLAREAGVAGLAAATRADQADVLDSLSRLYRRGLVRVGDRGWATSHDMLTEVVVAGLDPADRSRLHADLAGALRSEGDPALLAHHLCEAGDTHGAADAFALAAQRALDTFADDEAVHLAELGLALAPSTPVRASLRETRGEARQRRGDILAAREDLRAALAESATGPARARILARLAMLASGADDIVHAAQLAELAVVEARGDAAARARALEVASVLDMNSQREDRSADRAAEALALYERLGDAGGMARILDARAMAQFLDGDVGAGGAALRRAADLFDDSGDLVRVVTPRSTAGHALVFAGQAEQGLVQITAALKLAETLGHLEGRAYALWHRTEALAALGRGAEATEDSTEALAIATRIGHRGWTATGWRAVGIAAQHRGDLDEALRAFRRSLELSEHLGLFACWAAARAAMVLVSRGAPAEAAPLVERALEEGPPLGHYEARWARVEVSAALGDVDTPELARHALERMEAGGVRQGRERLASLAG